MVLESICRFWLLYRFVLLFPGGFAACVLGFEFWLLKEWCGVSLELFSLGFKTL